MDEEEFQAALDTEEHFARVVLQMTDEQIEEYQAAMAQMASELVAMWREDGRIRDD